MVKMHKLTKGGQTIYPATITDAVVNPNTRKSLTAELSELSGKQIKYDLLFKGDPDSYIFSKSIKNGYNTNLNIILEIGKKYILYIKNISQSNTILWGNINTGNTALATILQGENYTEFIYDKEYANLQIQSAIENIIYIIEDSSELISRINNMEDQQKKMKDDIKGVNKELYGDSSEYPTQIVKIKGQYTSILSYISPGKIYKFEAKGIFSKMTLYGNLATGLDSLITLTPQEPSNVVTIPNKEYINFQFDTKGYSTDTAINITQQKDADSTGLVAKMEELEQALSNISVGTENVFNNLLYNKKEEDIHLSLVKENALFRDGSYITLEGTNVYDVPVMDTWEGRYIEVSVSKPQYGFLQSIIGDNNEIIGTFDANMNKTLLWIPIGAKIIRLSNLTANLSEPKVSLPANTSIYEKFDNLDLVKKYFKGYLNLLVNDRINKSYLYDYKWGVFDKTVFVFVGDDGHKNLGAIYNVFHAKKVPLCAAIITITGDGLMRDTNYTLLELCLKIEEDGGEILAHPHNYEITGEEDYKTILKKFNDVKRYFLKYGFQSRGVIAVGAGIVGNAKIDRAVRSCFEFSDHYGLVTSEAYNCPNPNGGYGRSWIGTWGDNMESVKTTIDNFALTPQLIVVGMHNYSTSDNESYPKNEDPDSLAQIIDYIKSKNECVIMSYSDAYDTYAKRMSQ